MSPHRRICVLFLCACALLAVLSPAAHAFQTAVPGFTVIVSFPPEDLDVSLRFHDGEGFISVQLPKEQIAWEARYRFTSAMVPQAGLRLEKAMLAVSGGGKTFECPLPELALSMHDSDMLFLDIARWTVTDKPVGRTVSLVSMRVLLTLMLEGALFFVFGYRKKRSWIAFATINLTTQGALNVVLSLLFTSPYLLLILFLLEVPVLIVELIAFAVSVSEHRRLRTVAYVLVANILSLGLGGLLITYLPV